VYRLFWLFRLEWKRIFLCIFAIVRASHIRKLKVQVNHSLFCIIYTCDGRCLMCTFLLNHAEVAMAMPSQMLLRGVGRVVGFNFVLRHEIS
jgi:hypothetical protein